MWRKKQYAIAETGGFPHVVRDEDDRFAARFPDLLNIAVKLLARKRIKGSEWFIHEKHARIRRECASERNALLHSTGKFVDVGMFKSR